MQAKDLKGATFCAGNCGATAGTTTTFTTANAVSVAINGKANSLAALTNSATPTTDANTGAAFVAVGASKGCIFVVGVNASDALKVTQGPIEDLTTEADGANASFIKAPQFPAVPDDVCPIAYIVTKVGASGTAWTFGSSNLAGPPSNVLHTFVSIMTMPDRPQIA